MGICMHAWIQIQKYICFAWACPSGSDGRESTCNAGDPGLISGLGRSPGKGNGNPLQYLCLGNSMDRGAWQDTVHGVKELDTTERLTLHKNTLTDLFYFFGGIIKQFFNLQVYLLYFKIVFLNNHIDLG